VGADLGLAMARLVYFPLLFSFFSYLWGLVVISIFALHSHSHFIHHVYDLYTFWSTLLIYLISMAFLRDSTSILCFH
jgi:hypothetical protein